MPFGEVIADHNMGFIAPEGGDGDPLEGGGFRVDQGDFGGGAEAGAGDDDDVLQDFSGNFGEDRLSHAQLGVVALESVGIVDAGSEEEFP